MPLLTIGMIVATFFPVPAASQTADIPLMELRPACDALTQEEEDACPPFAVRDPMSKQTPPLSQDDVLDMDLVVRNPGGLPVSRVRAWIPYDPILLEGVAIEPSDQLTVPEPGETLFSSQEGYIKVHYSSPVPVTDTVIRVARITLRVLAADAPETALSFADPTETADSRTGVFVAAATGGEENVLGVAPGSLIVQLNAADAATPGDTAATSSSPSSLSASSASASSSSLVPVSTVFTMLQVQNVRITTEGSSVFLAWDALPSSELAGYNVYYGTISGKYLQRRSVSASETSLTLRSLPEGATYYVAVRGVNTRDQETEFSQEVGISVGNPRTSTSPLTGTVDRGPDGRAPTTDGAVAGDTGLPSVLLLLALASAVCGTGLALRRQFSTTHTA